MQKTPSLINWTLDIIFHYKPILAIFNWKDLALKGLKLWPVIGWATALALERKHARIIKAMKINNIANQDLQTKQKLVNNRQK